MHLKKIAQSERQNVPKNRDTVFKCNVAVRDTLYRGPKGGHQPGI